MLRYCAGFLLFMFGQSVAMACSPPPPIPGKLSQTPAINIDKTSTTLVEVAVTRAAKWPDLASLRVTKVHWGKLAQGAVLTVQPQPGSMCGPGELTLGTRGLIRITDRQLKLRSMAFFGFLDQPEVDAYRRLGLLSR